MFSKIVVALNDLPESQCALRTAIDPARSFSASFSTVSISGDLPAYASFAIVADPAAPATMREDRSRIQAKMHDTATRRARELDVHATSAIVEGRQLHAVLRFLKEEKADLLVICLQQRQVYLSGLWSSVYDLAQDATCSVLGVH
jgi:nucleotide-binding universal stress UspA family protein